MPTQLSLKSLLLLTLLAACGDKDGDTGASATGACATLCTGGGFAGGAEVDYGGGVVECTCEGSGTGISQDECTDYCADFGVAAEYAYLTSEVSTDDKCVCDGTQG